MKPATTIDMEVLICNRIIQDLEISNVHVRSIAYDLTNIILEDYIFRGWGFTNGISDSTKKKMHEYFLRCDNLSSVQTEYLRGIVILVGDIICDLQLNFKLVER